MSAKQESMVKSTTRREDGDNALFDQLWPKLRPFQREAVEFATQGKPYRHYKSNEQSPRTVEKVSSKKRKQPLHREKKSLTDSYPQGRVLLADEMGLGKTVTALAIASYYQKHEQDSQPEWPLLILCQPSLRYTWPNEMERFWPSLPPSAAHMVQGFSDTAWIEALSNKAHDGSIQVVVLTYSLIQQRSAVAHALLEQVQREPENPLFPTIICDESHNLKQRDSQRSQMLLPILQASKRLLLLSGTPALARPTELWTQLSTLKPGTFGSFQSFAKQYCAPKRVMIYGRGGRRFPRMDYTGSSNLDELHELLKPLMIRRLKTDVLDELPPKQRSIVPLKPTHTSDAKAAMQALKDAREDIHEMMAHHNQSSEAYGGASSSAQSKQALMRAYQATGTVKAAAAIEYLLDWLQGSTEKIVVFAHHQTVLDHMDAALHKQKAEFIRIDGQVPANIRHQLVRSFRTKATIRVALLSMTAAGVGLTLTAASFVLFAELNWTPGVLAQAEDRVHRIGQAKVCQIIYCVCQDPEISLDPTMCVMLGKKISTLATLIDGERGDRSAFLSEVNEAEAISDKNAQSGQDELTNFFALIGDKCTTTTSRNKSGKRKQHPRVIGRGSIESFFAKAHATSNKSPPPSSISTVQPSETAPYGPPDSSSVEWSCTLCTLDNKQPRKTTNVYECNACGLPFSVCDTNQSKRPLETFVTPTTTSKKRKPGIIPTPSSLVIDLSSDGEENDCFNAIDRNDPVIEIIDSPTVASKISLESWLFSVSKNSGRVSIHYKEDFNSTAITCCNFQIDQVLSTETLNAPFAHGNRFTAKRSGPSTPSFDAQELQDVVNKAFQSIPEKVFSKSNTRSLIRQTRDFCTQYMRLRPVEQKSLQTSGQLFESHSLSRVAAQLMVEPSGASGACTERYAGGFRERAYQKQQSGSKLSSTERTVLEGHGCAWCGNRLKASQIAAETVYCSQSCAEQGRLRGGGMYASSKLRAAMFTLEGGICRLCKVDAHWLFKQVCAIPPPDRLNRLLDAGWKLPSSRKALDRLLRDPKEGEFWQVDHIQAVCLGGGDCGLDNLRTLCVPCHRLETKKLRADLNRRNGASKLDSKHKQVDIRSAFRFVSNKRGDREG